MTRTTRGNTTMKERALILTGTVGTIVAAICCFTPVLVIGLGVAGLAAWVGWIDYVVVPALVISMLILGYGLVLRRRRRNSGCGVRASIPCIGSRRR